MASLAHIDTCLACYLTDHHNRPGEYLLGVEVDAETTYAQIREALSDEFHWYGPEEGPADEEFEAALSECFADVSDETAAFDDSLDAPSEDDDMGEPCQAWFLLEWETEE